MKRFGNDDVLKTLTQNLNTKIMSVALFLRSYCWMVMVPCKFSVQYPSSYRENLEGKLKHKSSKYDLDLEVK